MADVADTCRDNAVQVRKSHTQPPHKQEDLVLDENDLASRENDLILDAEDELPAKDEQAADDLVLDDDMMDEAPVFQQAKHEGAGSAMVAKEADEETAGDDAVPQRIQPLRAPALSVSSPCSTEQDGKPGAKVVVVGNSGVGKTSLLLRFAQGHYNGATRSTVGIDLHSQLIDLPDGGTLRLQLWDTAGQEQFESLTTSYFRAAKAVILVYDVTKPASFSALTRWMQEVDRRAPAEVVKLVLGCKSDETLGVNNADTAAFAAKHGAMCELCSAKDATNVTPVFERLAVRIVRAGFDPDGSKGAVRLSTGRQQQPQKKKCC
mmetsp:Transcript_58971/g.97490  ORF Transcript_58971/g.97490 Transcript_58971/m.97490 type:complete len:320 (+) Transcript_58971:35-994(+)